MNENIISFFSHFVAVFKYHCFFFLSSLPLFYYSPAIITLNAIFGVFEIVSL
jgi:hypothetical protein